jgi:hypothetical protein
LRLPEVNIIISQMDNKKRFASLMEDHSLWPGMAVRNGGRSGSQSGDESPAPSSSELHLEPEQDHDALSCVYVSRSLLLSLLLSQAEAMLGLTMYTEPKKHPKRTVPGTDSSSGRR